MLRLTRVSKRFYSQTVQCFSSENMDYFHLLGVKVSHFPSLLRFIQSSNPFFPFHCLISDIFLYNDEQRSYQISQDILKKQYKDKMKQLHPDKHTLKPVKEKEEAAKDASNMTRAYETIKDDYDRALHLLKLEGYPMGENFSVSISNLGIVYLYSILFPSTYLSNL